MDISNYFNTTIWSEQKTEFIKSLTKASDKYIKAAKNTPEAKEHIKKFGDFGRSYHSTSIIHDNKFVHTGIGPKAHSLSKHAQIMRGKRLRQSHCEHVYTIHLRGLRSRWFKGRIRSL